MNVRYLLLSLMFSLSAYAAPVCEFRPILGTTGGCFDFGFTRALEKGDVHTVRQMLHDNPNLVFACNNSPNDDFDQFSSLTYAICKGGNKRDLPEIVDLLIHNGADTKCQSRNLRVTAEVCANNIFDPQIRNKVLELLHPAN